MCDHHLIIASTTLGVVVALQTPFSSLRYEQRIQTMVGARKDGRRQRDLDRLFVLYPNSQHTTPPYRTLMLLQGRNSDLQDFEFKEFDIDDILSEAEDALKAAGESLENDKLQDVPTISTNSTATINKVFTKPQLSPPSRNNTEPKFLSSSPSQTKLMDAETIKDTIACTMGGILFGSIMGSIATFQFPGILSALEGEDNFSMSHLLSLPILGGLTLGTVGLIGASQSNILGTVTKSLLGVPILALVSAILSAVQALFASLKSAAQRQTEKIVNDIKALPQNVANSAQQTVKSSVESAVEEITSLPRKAADMVVQSSVQVADIVKSSVEAAVEEVTSIPRNARDRVVESSNQAVETVKSLPSKAKDNVVASGIFSHNFLLALVVIPSLIALGFLALDALFAGRVPLPSL
jgi:hypothetical protein